ncbi:glycosyltransferase family protein [Nitrospinae bacterium AH_259_B05_G02_I21]|nr:glycosyltransferase family protein [Nitrospinae bacterium AH_259_B05_G02_I21]MDA2931656.1 glycosyltransferase family protein [Nitrospinae bacterium AH-259-F20]
MIAIILQARMNSERLPGKVMADIAGRPMLAHVVERLRLIEGADAVTVATSTNPADDHIEEYVHTLGLRCLRGSEDDVLDRFYSAARELRASTIVRATADDPLTDYESLTLMVSHHLATGADYTCIDGLPRGAQEEVVSFQALERCHREATAPHHKEHVFEYILEHPEMFIIERLVAPPDLCRPELRITVDTSEDLEVVRLIYKKLYQPGRVIHLREVISFLDAHPKIRAINAQVEQKTAGKERARAVDL